MQNVSNYDKVRIIALYVMIKNGIPEENLIKLFTHAQIGPKEQDMIRNLNCLGINVVNDVSGFVFSVFCFPLSAEIRDYSSAYYYFFPLCLRPSHIQSDCAKCPCADGRPCYLSLSLYIYEHIELNFSYAL